MSQVLLKNEGFFLEGAAVKKFTLICLTVLSVSLNSFAQPNILWTETYGSRYTELCYGLTTTGDGGFLLAGTFENPFGSNAEDVYLVKTDESGDTLWTLSFGQDYSESCYSVEQSDDGGFVIAGAADDVEPGNPDVYFLKVSASGAPLFSQIHHLSGNEWIKCIRKLDSGGFIMLGTTDSYGAGGYDLYLLKVDSIGLPVWEHTFGTADDDFGNSVIPTLDKGYLLTGSLFNGLDSDLCMIKTDSSGNEQWRQTFGGPDYDEGFKVRQTEEGGFIVCGTTFSCGSGNSDVYLIKTDNFGNEEWISTFGDVSLDGGADVQETDDNGFIVAGYEGISGSDDHDIYIVRTDPYGTEQWSMTNGGALDDRAVAVEQMPDGGYIIAAQTQSYGSGCYDYYLVRLDEQGSVVQGKGGVDPSTYTLYPCSPNPFNASAAISFNLPTAEEVSLKIFDISGREVHDFGLGILDSGTHSFIWDASRFASGIYFAVLERSGQYQTQKLVLMK